MPTVVVDLPRETDRPRKRWTRPQYEEFVAATFATERVELVDGELISKMGKKRPHVFVLNHLKARLDAIFGTGFVNAEAPIDVAPAENAINEPEPDIIVLRRPDAEFSRNPQPDDVALLVEISDTTLAFDLNTKSGLYARAGICEYWVLDVAGRRLFVHRDPAGGRYGDVKAYRADEVVTPLAAPGAVLRAGDVLPPPVA